MVFVSCSDCGKPISNLETKCPNCGAPVESPVIEPHEDERTLVTTKYSSYDEVPWYRCSTTNRLFFVSAFATKGIVPLVFVTYVLLLTGDIYYKPVAGEVNLRVWGKGDKTVVSIILLFNLLMLGYVMFFDTGK